MEPVKVVPWVLVVVLGGLCWQQRQTISVLKNKNSALHQQVNSVDSESEATTIAAKNVATKQSKTKLNASPAFPMSLIFWMSAR